MMLLVGDCWTMGAHGRVEAVHLDGERIVDAGSAADLGARYPAARVIRVETLTPGVHDAHLHPLSLG